MRILNRDYFVLWQPRLIRIGVVLHTVIPAALIVCMVCFVSVIDRNGSLRLSCQRPSGSSSKSENNSPEKTPDSRHSLPQVPIETIGRKLIRFGSSTSLTGACATMGNHLCEGIQAALAEANRNQSVDQYELIAMDDIYSPLLSQANARKLLSDPSVMACVGNLGTPTAITTASILSDSQVTAFGFYTGSSLLRQPMQASYMMHFRASYASLEGYILGRIITKAVVSADRPLARETLRQRMLKLDEFELEPGFVVRLPMDRMRSKNTLQQQFLWLIEFTPEETRPFEWQS